MTRELTYRGRGFRVGLHLSIPRLRVQWDWKRGDYRIGISFPREERNHEKSLPWVIDGFHRIEGIELEIGLQPERETGHDSIELVAIPVEWMALHELTLLIRARQIYSGVLKGNSKKWNPVTYITAVEGRCLGFIYGHHSTGSIPSIWISFLTIFPSSYFPGISLYVLSLPVIFHSILYLSPGACRLSSSPHAIIQLLSQCPGDLLLNFHSWLTLLLLGFCTWHFALYLKLHS